VTRNSALFDRITLPLQKGNYEILTKESMTEQTSPKKINQFHPLPRRERVRGNKMEIIWIYWKRSKGDEAFGNTELILFPKKHFAL